MRSVLPAVLADGVVHLASIALIGGVLLAAGQPLFAEDSWWHLGMGAAYAADGPFLSDDPFLHGALGAPAPAAWLADLAFWGVHEAFGFTGLRVFHAALVAGILGLAWWMLRRASASPVFASLATAAFAAVSAYRLFQLRPHLFTIAAALLVVALLADRGRLPSWPRVAAATVVFALWANLHGAFLVGIVLVAAAAAGCGAAALLSASDRAFQVARVRRLLAALALGGGATLLNPQGAAPHGLYFAAGEASPELSKVADEWVSAGLLSFPAPGSLPNPPDWVLLWVLVVSTGAIAVHWAIGRARASARRPGAPSSRVDPAWIALAVAGVVGAVVALRLVWLVALPLALVGQQLSGRTREMRLRVVAGVASLALLLAFAVAGNWPRISSGVRPGLYARPYPATKFHAHAVWFMKDAGLEGRLFNDYGSGNFLGYWLAPRLRVFVNGSLNVPKERLRAHAGGLRGRGGRQGETLEQMLDRYGVDVFFGVGLPLFSYGRPNVQTTAHLESSAGWVTVFRNLRSAVYLRRGERNAANLRRVADFYAAAGVPFDTEVGFDVGRVISEAPGWAFAHGVIPADLDRVRRATASLDPAVRGLASRRLAGLQAALGLYDRSISLDRRRVAGATPSVPAARRLVWALLRERRFPEAADAARQLASLADPGDEASLALADAARRIAGLAAAGHAAEATGIAAGLPVFDRSETSWLLMGYREPEARTR